MQILKRWSTLWALLVVALLLATACAPTAAPADSAAPAATGSQQAKPPAEAEEEAAAPAAAAEGEKVVRVDTSTGKGTFFNPVYLVGYWFPVSHLPLDLDVVDDGGCQWSTDSSPGDLL